MEENNNENTSSQVNIDNLASDIQSFLNSVQSSFEENREKDARINMDLSEDNQDAKDVVFDETGSNENIEQLSTEMNSSIDTSSISEDDSDFEESDLNEIF